MKEIEQLKSEFKELKNAQQETICEEYGIVDDADAYVESLNKGLEDIFKHYVMDYLIIKNATKFMTGPVVCYQGKAIEAQTIKFETIKELRDFLKDKQYLLYVIVAHASVIYDELLAPNTKSIGAKISYLFRGHILE
jgi:Asp-tRNA(Asn)/Glu-tRNA(Gln) amidotransferase B subunit